MRLVRSAICRDEEPVSLGPVLNCAMSASSRLGRDILFAATTWRRPRPARKEGRERRDAVSEGASSRGRGKNKSRRAKPEPIGFCRGADARRYDAADARATRPRRWKPPERAIVHHAASSARAFGEATHRWARSGVVPSRRADGTFRESRQSSAGVGVGTGRILTSRRGRSGGGGAQSHRHHGGHHSGHRGY